MPSDFTVKRETLLKGSTLYLLYRCNLPRVISPNGMGKKRKRGGKKSFFKLLRYLSLKIFIRVEDECSEAGRSQVTLKSNCFWLSRRLPWTNLTPLDLYISLVLLFLSHNLLQRKWLHEARCSLFTAFLPEDVHPTFLFLHKLQNDCGFKYNAYQPK